MRGRGGGIVVIVVGELEVGRRVTCSERSCQMVTRKLGCAHLGA